MGNTHVGVPRQRQPAPLDNLPTAESPKRGFDLLQRAIGIGTSRLRKEHALGAITFSCGALLSVRLFMGDQQSQAIDEQMRQTATQIDTFKRQVNEAALHDGFSGAEPSIDDAYPDARFTGEITIKVGTCALEGVDVTLQTATQDMPPIPHDVQDITSYTISAGHATYTFPNWHDLVNQTGQTPCTTLYQLRNNE